VFSKNVRRWLLARQPAFMGMSAAHRVFANVPESNLTLACFKPTAFIEVLTRVEKLITAYASDVDGPCK